MMGFRQAVQDESQRQIYLDDFLKRNPNDNVAVLVYNKHKKPGMDRVTELQFKGRVDADEADSLRKLAYESTQYAFLLITTEMIGKGERHPIFVNPRAFQQLDEADFAYNLVDHEYFHTHDFRYGIPLPNGIVINHNNASQLQPVTLEALIDSRALLFQLINGAKKGMHNSGAFGNALNGFLQYHRALISVKPANQFEKEVIATQIASYQSFLSQCSGF